MIKYTTVNKDELDYIAEEIFNLDVLEIEEEEPIDDDTYSSFLRNFLIDKNENSKKK